MLFAYEDHVSLDSTTLSTVGTINSGTLANLKTRQLVEDMEVNMPSLTAITADFDEDRSVGFAAILNHINVGGAPTASGGGHIVLLKDSGGGLIANESSAILTIDTDLYMRHYYVIFDQTYTNVRKVEFNLNGGGSKSMGRLWAGPLFQPTNIQAQSFGFGVSDPSGLSTSRGGQAYADPYNRLRTLSARLPALTEAEAFGDATDSTVINAQDMLFTVGTHRELILIPYTGDSSLIHKWGLYGHLTGFSEITPVRPGDATIGRLFELSLNAIEER